MDDHLPWGTQWTVPQEAYPLSRAHPARYRQFAGTFINVQDTNWFFNIGPVFQVKMVLGGWSGGGRCFYVCP